MTHYMSWTLTRGEFDFDLEIEYSVAPLIGAVGPSWNDPGSPAEGGEVTALTARDELGEEFALTDAETQKIEAWIYENHDYSSDDYWED